MKVGGGGDCLAINIAKGTDSLPTTPRNNRYILTMIDCCTRFAVAVPIPDQFSAVILFAIINQYFTLYGTPRRIFTDHSGNFEFSYISDFCYRFRISKIRTTYHPQSNGFYERFNQTLNCSLRKVLHDSQQSSWNIYLNFAVLSCNLCVYFRTGFSPFYLIFGSEARLPANLIFSSSFESLDATLEASSSSQGLLSL